MRFVPRAPDESVNVSRRHPLKELAVLLAGTLALVALIYVLLGLAVDFTATRVSPEFEAYLAGAVTIPFSPTTRTRLQGEAERILGKLLDVAEDTGPVKVMVAQHDDVNALAFPGGSIILFSAVMEQAESENELAMILAHELGHLAHRDHLRRLGRSMVLALIMTTVLGYNSAADQVLALPMTALQSQYSRSQEEAADRYALKVLERAYGHVGGSTDFFARNAGREGQLPAFFAMHPSPRQRLAQLHSLAAARGYASEATLPNPVTP